MGRRLALGVLALAGCVADPVLPADLSTPADLATTDGATADGALPDLAFVDVAPADLPFSDLLFVDLSEPDLAFRTPQWAEVNDGLDGASLLYVAVGSASLFVSNLYDIYESTDAGQTFTRKSIDWNYAQDGIASIAAHDDYLYVGLSRGRILRIQGTATTEITAPGFVGTKPPVTAGIDYLEADRLSGSQRLYASDGKDVYEFDGAALTAPDPKPDPWRKISGSTGFPTVQQTIYRMRTSADGAALFVAATAGLLKWAGGAWTVDVTPGARPLHVDVIGAGTTPSLAVVSYDGDVLHSNGTTWNTSLASVPSTPSLISQGDDGSLVTTSAMGIHRLATLGAASWSLDFPSDELFIGMERSLDRTHVYLIGERGLWQGASSAIGSGDFVIAGLHGTAVERIVESPTTAGRLYAATNHGLFVSADLGTTWAAVEDARLSTARINDVVVTADGIEDVLYALTFDTVFRSDDGGGTFDDLGFTASALVTHPTLPSYVFFCRGSLFVPDRLFVSANRGGDFENYPTGPSTCNALAFANDGTLYTSSDNVLWRTTQPLTPSMALSLIGDITADPVQMRSLSAIPGSNDLLALSAHIDPNDRQIHRVGVGGSTLQPKPGSAGGLFALTMGPADPTRIWVAGKYGVYFGELGTNAPFRLVADGLPGGNVLAITQSRSTPSRLWVGVEERGIYRAE